MQLYRRKLDEYYSLNKREGMAYGFYAGVCHQIVCALTFR